MSPDFETPMNALFARMVASATIVFTADSTVDDATLSNVSSFEHLFVGLPVFGPGVSRGAVISGIDANAGTMTLSGAVTGNGTAAEFTTGFLTTGRRVKHWQQVPDQPALFLRRTGTLDEYDGDLPIVTIEGEIWIYSKAGEDPAAAPDVALSNLDRRARDSLEADDDMRCTLGGLVYWCRIEGRSDYSPGDQSGQGISRIPVRITLRV
jgi:hypothetical protein